MITRCIRPFGVTSARPSAQSACRALRDAGCHDDTPLPHDRRPVQPGLLGGVRPQLVTPHVQDVLITGERRGVDRVRRQRSCPRQVPVGRASRAAAGAAARGPAGRWRARSGTQSGGGFHAPPDADGTLRSATASRRPGGGRDWGTELAAGLLVWARDHGAVRCLASVSPGNAASIAIVRRPGFVHAGEHVDETDGSRVVHTLELR